MEKDSISLTAGYYRVKMWLVVLSIISNAYLPHSWPSGMKEYFYQSN